MPGGEGMRRMISLVLSGVVTLVAGCSNGALQETQIQIPAASPAGMVHGGQQAIGGAAINLYEAGTAGYGSTPTLLYSTTTGTTGAGLGTFSFPIAGWSVNCTATGSNSSSPVYLTSTGGNAGSGTNSAIV